MIRQRVERLAEGLRRRIPTSLVPLVVRLRLWVAWSRASVREECRRQVGFVLEHTDPGADLDAVARDYCRHMIWRGEARWHPELLVDQRVVGVEHLRRARDLGRGVLINYMHHGAYDGAFASIARQGLPCQILVYPYMVEPGAASWMRQHVSLGRTHGNTIVSAGIGTAGIKELLAEGGIVPIATDVPGRTEVRFAGRDLRGSFGAARIAHDTGAPVVLMTAERDEQGPFLRLHEALDPAAYDTAHALLADMVAENERAVLAWPEAYDLPLSRWALPDGTRLG